MDELKAKFKELNDNMKEKYHDVIVKIAEKEQVDMGVAFDMLKTVTRGGKYLEGIEVSEETITELERDYEELVGLSIQIASGLTE